MSIRANTPGCEAPPREDWPEPAPHTMAGKLLTDLVISTFRLNGRFLEIAQRLASDGALTAAWWQVLGGVLDHPRTVAEVARTMGMTRQGVQRVADLLVDRDLAEYRPNPAHRRAKLLACTDAGYWAVRQIALAQHPWANETAAKIGAEQLQDALTTMQQLIALLETELEQGRHTAVEQTPSRPRRAARKPGNTPPRQMQRTQQRSLT